MILIYSITIFFVGTGVLLPIIGADFGYSSYSENSDLLSDVSKTMDTGNRLTFWKIITSVTSMFFWTFGLIPWVIDLLVFLPLRIILVLTVVRNVWVGGGG